MRQPTQLQRFPSDWPTEGAIDLARHDLPHASSTTERWYLNAHLAGPGGHASSLFAAFFRVVHEVHPGGRVEYAHSLTWGLSDLVNRAYWARSYVEASAPRIGLERIRAGRGAKDERIDRALVEALEKGRVPLPDRVFPWPARTSLDALDLDFGACRLQKLPDGRYLLSIDDEGPRGPLQAALTFTVRKPPVRHGDEGVVRGARGEDMFHYFVPRCDVAGTLAERDGVLPVAGSGWYDHEFGRPPPGEDGDLGRLDAGTVAWNWVSVQLDDGTDVSAYELVRADSGASAGRYVVLVDAAGRRRAFTEFTLVPAGDWQSTRTFERYPTRLKLEVPAARLSLDLRAAFGDQEVVTALSKPAFWEGRCDALGTLQGRVVRGPAFVERSGFCDTETLDDFFERVGEVVRASVRRVLPLVLDRAHALRLVAAPGREHYLDGVDLDQLSRALIAPVRAVADRGGKAWRSYAALACCEVVGGDSRRFAGWLALPELVHTGSLIVDDVEDRSAVRRGGPAAHVLFGEGLAVNAGTAAYFLGDQLLTRSLLSDADKLRLYDLYFGALRAGHAGQAIDLDGLASCVPATLESGDHEALERRVLAIHRLKTAAPAGAFARMGAIAGGGAAAQVEALGDYFESLGLAFQIVDDVLDLRGFEGGLTQKGEDVSQGKVTLPVAKALGRLDPAAGRALWALVSSRPTDPAVIAEVIAQIEGCGALDACQAQARALVEFAWEGLGPLLEESHAKLMLRAFGWYVLERQY